MTMQVTTFQDILNALEQNPALRDQLRSHILTEELLQLPAQFVLLRADVDELKNGQTRLEEGQARIEERTQRLEEGQARVEERTQRLEEGQSRLEERQGRLEGRMDRLEGRFGNVEGNLYEQRSANRILSRVAFLGIESPQIASSNYGPVRQGFYDAMATAIQGGAISQVEYLDLTDADLIIRGRNSRHAVVEISLGPDEDDIARVVRRSDILHRSTGEEVTPMIATPHPHPAFVQEAEGRQVRVLDIPV